MLRQIPVLLGVVAVAVGLATCKPSVPEAEDPIYGKEPCAHCAMLVSEPRFAAQLQDDGPRRYFDDVGCMVNYMQEHAGTGVQAWVHNHDGEGWLPAHSARYRSGVRTPMDSGFVAVVAGTAEGLLTLEQVQDAMRQRAAQRQQAPAGGKDAQH